jgi:2-keto-3-deoxy-L-rhamnonate aldolase RhmA
VARLTGLPTVARVADALPHLISKIIDMGADGIILPRVESLEQVALAIKALRFFPAGRKGCGGFSLFRNGESFQEINSSRLLFIQIESDEGIACLPDILKEHGDEIAGILVGPYDMSIMSGVPLQTKSETMLARIRNVFEISKSFHQSCGIFVDSADDLKMWKDIGANIFWTGTELSLYGGALRNLGEAFKKI